jgi:hypothetical protein
MQNRACTGQVPSRARTDCEPVDARCTLSTPAAGDIEKFATEVADRLARIEVLRVNEIDGIELSPHTKRPFKAAIYKEALIWRMAELGRDAMAAFSDRRYASAMLLTRAAIETVSAFWYFLKTLRLAIDTGNLEEAEAQFRRIVFGSRNDPEMPTAVNVLNCIDHLNKTVEGARENYDILSEYSHPNYAAVTGLFAKISPPSPVVSFGQAVGRDPRPVGMANLSAALMLFEYVHEKVCQAMPEFIVRCEQLTESKNIDVEDAPESA